jgi:hypothetical protein
MLMNLALAQTIVGCLRMRGETGRCTQRLRSFDLRDWTRTLRWLDLSGLALYLWRHLKDSQATDVVPFPIRDRLEQNHRENQVRVIDATKEFAILNGLWEQAAARFAVLKGFAMIPDYCWDATLRTQYDHDYLLEARSLPAAVAALRSAGYRRKNPHERHPLAFIRSQHSAQIPLGKVNFYSPHLARPVELHTRLWEANDEGIEIALAEGALDRACLRVWGGLTFPALDDADALVFQVLHAFRHVLRNWCRLSIFLEIARFLEMRLSDTEFWEQFRNRIEGRQWLPASAGVVFSLASNLFAVPVPRSAGPFTVEAMTPAMIWWVEKFGKKSALRNFQGSKHSLFLHREFIDDSSVWRGVRRRRLFPFAQVPHVLKLRVGGRTLPLRVAWAQGIHVARRARFHIAAALRYALAYPGWYRRFGPHTEAAFPRRGPLKQHAGLGSAVRVIEE